MAGRTETDAGIDRSATGTRSRIRRIGPSNEQSRLGGASALVAAVALLIFADVHAGVAVVGALAVLAAWYLLAPTYAFALGHVALVAALPEGALAAGSVPVGAAVVEVGLLGILLASVPRVGEFADPDIEGSSRSVPPAAVGVTLVLGWALVGGALAWASARSALDPAVAAGLLVALTGLSVYGLHRYQLVSLGLAEDGDE